MHSKLFEKISLIGVISIFLTMCAPPQASPDELAAIERAKRDSVKQVRSRNVSKVLGIEDLA